MAADLWLFIPLAILSNTAFPLPFDPVVWGVYVPGWPAWWMWRWRELAIPAWVGAALVVASSAWIMWQARHDRFTKLFLVRPAVHISTSAAMLNAIREARLRPEFASLYPDLAPGVWVPACSLRDFVLERGLYQRRTGLPSHRRLLLESHFEFRGGPLSRHHGWTGPHERTDEATA